MAGVCSPVTIVTTYRDSQPHGTTVSAFASLSLDPPMVSIALDKRSSLLASVLATRRFGVNVLSQDQDNLAMLFARRSADRFSAAEWHLDQGLPRLPGAAGWMVCELAQEVRGGDHLLLLGVVTQATPVEVAPLVYGHRMFGTHSAFAERLPRAGDQHAATPAR
ncbi:flavin reductase family protein [Pseudonocardia sp.]|uniref:flavin reductase family protein n=1 Tax=Pseudonocardia sp. TaxID=60912 RepID=UPI00262CB417|nr:flavin reductase family protein [Pseudonocardia sp.]